MCSAVSFWQAAGCSSTSSQLQKEFVALHFGAVKSPAVESESREKRLDRRLLKVSQFFLLKCRHVYHFELAIMSLLLIFLFVCLFVCTFIHHSLYQALCSRHIQWSLSFKWKLNKQPKYTVAPGANTIHSHALKQPRAQCIFLAIIVTKDNITRVVHIVLLLRSMCYSLRN